MAEPGRDNITMVGRLAAIAIGVVVFLIFGELVLRALVPVPRVFPFDTDTIEFTGGTPRHLLKPNTTSVMTDGYFREEVRTNQFGHRDLYDDSKPPGLLAFGDSQTFGHGSAVTDSWPEILQSQLDVNVVNVGIWGYGLGDYLALMTSYIERYDFDTAIYGMTFNDFCPAFAAEREADEGEGAGAMQWARMRTVWLRRFTALGIVTSAAVNNVLSRLELETATIPIERCRSISIEAIHALDDILRENGKSLAIVYLPSPNQARPDIWALMQRRTNYSNRTVPDLLAAGLRPSIPFIDATPALEARYLESGSQRSALMLEVDPHYNRSGHEVLAGEALKLIRREGPGS